MGGFGSGSHWGSKKTTVEDCRHLDANRWMREGILRAGVWLTGSWAWWRDEQRTEQTASIGYEVNTKHAPPRLRLFYTFTDRGEDVDYRISLRATHPHLGGLRWWFICPLIVNGVACHRRVGKLYLAPSGRYFGCRHCYDLTYTSCQESRQYDSLYRHMAAQLGQNFAETKEIMKELEKRWKQGD